MTTDTVPKQVALHHPSKWTVGGMARCGHAGAVDGDHAVCADTDAVADAAALDQALRRAAARTFDRLDIDGCCSTNDTVLLLASGASGSPAQPELDDAVLRVCDDLCAQLQADAEGVTKRVTVTVTGPDPRTKRCGPPGQSPRQPGQDAMFGSDPNWAGCWRLSLGADGDHRPDRITVSFNGSPVCIDGIGAPGARQVDLSGPTSTSSSTRRRRWSGNHSDHRSFACLRRREFGLQLMTINAEALPTQLKAQVLAEALPGSSSCTARSSSSNTAAMP